MRNTIQIAGIIITFLFTGASIVLDFWQVAIFAGLTIPLPMLSGIGFILFAVFMGWALLDKSNIIRGLEAHKPFIEADLLYDPLTGLYIEVKNKGETGQFMAQVTVLESTDDNLRWHWSPYDAYWDNEQTAKVSILSGLSRRIKLVSFEQRNLIGWLRLYKSAPDGVQYHDTAGYSIGVPYPQCGEVPEVYLRLCISSEPGASNGAVNKTLRIKASIEFEEEDTGS